MLVYRNLQDTVLQILILSACISLFMGLLQSAKGGWLEGTAIMLAVFIVVLVTSINDYLKDKQFRKLNATTDCNMIIVRRDGREGTIRERDLLVGDVVFISAGDIIPADAAFAQGCRLMVDESVITGESEIVTKEVYRPGDLQGNPFLISGSKVCEGSGYMIVCAVGINSVQGKTRRMLNVEEDETPLQEILGNLAALLGKLGIIVAALLLLISVSQVSLEAALAKEWNKSHTSELISSIIFSITIIVVAVPEGLPLAMTLSMAYSVFQMKDDQIFVRHLKGCEVMGAADTVLSDKTGTLTMNIMKVSAAEIMSYSLESIPTTLHKYLAEHISRNSTAFITPKLELIGNQTECALLRLISGWGFEYSRFRDLEKQLIQFGFSSNSKMMTSIYLEEEEYVKIYCKGAPEFILERCEMMLGPEMSIQEMTQEDKEKVVNNIENMNRNSLRCIALAYKLDSVNHYINIQDIQREEVENKLVYIGLIGIEDPLRVEAYASISQIKRAGVNVRMVTGDSKAIAFKIAKQSGIINQDTDDRDIDRYVIEGKQLREISGGLVILHNKDNCVQGYTVNNLQRLREQLDSISIVSRCTPEDKLILVVGLKAAGKVVAVTGDGSNDAPALKQSDIGIAMMSGSPISKEAADIVLLDDNFNSIVNSVKWGRNIYRSIRKFIQFQVTVNIVALATCIIASLTTKDTPISAVQMLWVNIIMDSFAALALATEPPGEDTLKSRPFSKNESLITEDMKISILTQCMYQLTVMLNVLFVLPPMMGMEYGWESKLHEHYTFLFHVFVIMQLFNEINCKKLGMGDYNIFKGFLNNYLFIYILFMTLFIQLAIVQLGGHVLSCHPLSLTQHLLAVAFGVGGLAVTFMVRYVIHKFRVKYKKLEEEEPLLI
jgi:Ca2+ transporting ATPase